MNLHSGAEIYFPLSVLGRVCIIEVFFFLRKYIYRGRVSLVGRAFECRAGGRGFDSRGRTNTQGLKITEK